MARWTLVGAVNETPYDLGWQAGYDGDPYAPLGEDWGEDAIEAWFDGYEDGDEQRRCDEQDELR